MFFRVDAVRKGRGRRVGCGAAGLLENRGFILGESLLEALDLGVEVLEEALLPLEQVEHLLRGQAASLKRHPRFACVHGGLRRKFRAPQDPIRMGAYSATTMAKRRHRE